MYQNTSTDVEHLSSIHDPLATPQSLLVLKNELLAIEHRIRQIAAQIDVHLAHTVASSTCPNVTGNLVSQMSAVQQHETATLQIQLFGSFSVGYGEKYLQRSGFGKSWEILKYLASYLGQTIHREVLMEALWPDVEPVAGKNRLKVAVHALRRALASLDAPGDLIRYNANGYHLNLQHGVTSDVAIFRQAWQQGRRYEANGDIQAALRSYNQATAVYSGEFLADDYYVEWTIGLREELRDIALQIFDHRSRLYQTCGEIVPAIEDLKCILAEDELREDIYRRIIAAYAELGQRNVARHWFEHCWGILDQQLGIEPEAATQELYQTILRD